MDFFDREREIKLLLDLKAKASTVAQFTVLTGRRRIGKTRLIKQAYGDDMIYWFVTRKHPGLLAKEFDQILRAKLNMPLIDTMPSLEEVFEKVFIIAISKPLTLVIDEFQNFNYVEKSFFSSLQKLWDQYKDKSKLNLIVSGSVLTMIKKIFQSQSEPLFGRADRTIKLQPFGTDTIKQILKKYNPNYTKHDLLLFYSITGGTPKYIELLIENGATDFETMTNFIFDKFSPFVEEGKNLLIEEFVQDYSIYFSILSLLAEGKTKRAEIENQMNKPVGGYIERLETTLELISRQKPILAKNNRLVRYKLNDIFLSFWFRFFYKYWSIVELENFDLLKEIFLRDYKVFAGKILEQYFITKLTETGNYTEIGAWWDRRGQNEIDIVALNNIHKIADIYEVKLNKDKISIEQLIMKSSALASQLSDYKFSYYGLSIEDM